MRTYKQASNFIFLFIRFLDNLWIFLMRQHQQAFYLKHHLHIWEIKLVFNSQLVLGLPAIASRTTNKSVNNHFSLISDPEQIRFANLSCLIFSCNNRIEHYSG